jgi:hypothetical protein
MTEQSRKRTLAGGVPQSNLGPEAAAYLVYRALWLGVVQYYLIGFSCGAGKAVF